MVEPAVERNVAVWQQKGEDVSAVGEKGRRRRSKFPFLDRSSF
jgi:hypothetical protein